MKLLLGFLFLFATSTSFAFKNDVVVDIPQEFSRSAILKITGELSEKELAQMSPVKIVRFEVDKNKKPIQGSGQRLHSSDGKVNEEIKLCPGIYHIIWNKMTMQIELKPNEKQEVKLRKIKVAKTYGENTVNIFLDLSAKDMHFDNVIAFWISENKEFCKVVAGATAKTNLAKDYCKAVESDNLATFLDFMINNFFTADGKVVKMYADGSTTADHHYIAKSLEEGDYVSVFPGVYGATIINKDGQAKTKLGIVVK